MDGRVVRQSRLDGSHMNLTALLLLINLHYGLVPTLLKMLIKMKLLKTSPLMLGMVIIGFYFIQKQTLLIGKHT